MVQAPPRRSTSTTGRPAKRPGGKGVLAVVVVAGLLCGGLLVVLRPFLSRLLQEPAATPIPSEYFVGYHTFYGQYADGLPQDFSAKTVTDRAQSCAAGGMAVNQPDYADPDSIGRARGGWVCLQGTQADGGDGTCPAPGTNLWRTAARPRLPNLNFVSNGHVIARSLGGDGAATRNGQCVNMVAQSSTPNIQMGAVERTVKGLVENPANAAVPVFYVVVPTYTATNYMPDSMWIFILSTLGEQPPREFKNEPHNISDVGGSR